MQKEQKQIIRYALDFEIVDLHTYSGYKGDLIVKITTKDRDTVTAVRKFALSLGIDDVIVKQNPALFEFEIYCITEDNEVYQLKPDDKKDNRI